LDEEVEEKEEALMSEVLLEVGDAMVKGEEKSDKFIWIEFLKKRKYLSNECDDLVTDVKDFGHTNGRFLVKRDSKKDRKGAVKSLTIRCKHSEKPRNSGDASSSQKRSRTSLRVNCPFRLLFTIQQGVWILSTTSATCYEHICEVHKPPADLRKLTPHDAETLASFLKYDVETSKLKAFLADRFPQAIFSAKMINNLRKKFNKQQLQQNEEIKEHLLLNSNGAAFETVQSMLQCELGAVIQKMSSDKDAGYLNNFSLKINDHSQKVEGLVFISLT
jgi:hypothetical protein